MLEFLQKILKNILFYMPEVPLNPSTNEEALLVAHVLEMTEVTDRLGRSFDPALVQEAGALACAWHKYIVSQGLVNGSFEPASGEPVALAPDYNPYDLLNPTVPPDSLDRDELMDMYRFPRPADLSPLHGEVVLNALRLVVAPDGRRVVASHIGHQAANFLATNSPDKEERLLFETLILPLMEQDAGESLLQ